jgi:hypothetical protein
MARGSDSKSVASQQEDDKSRTQPLREPDRAPAIDHSKVTRRKVLMLAKARTAADLKKATAPAQRDMLERALSDLERSIGEL